MADLDLLTPTERELRAVSGDFEISIPGVAMRFMRKLRLANLAVTMGSRGCVLFRSREEDRDDWFGSRLRSEYVPSLSGHVVDTVGAGDAFLAAATLALASGTGLNRPSTSDPQRPGSSSNTLATSPSTRTDCWAGCATAPSFAPSFAIERAACGLRTEQPRRNSELEKSLSLKHRGLVWRSFALLCLKSPP
jgi:sugar/nucleoside kinase (ribokinase family)